MHALVADRYGYLGAHQPMHAQPTWAEAFVVMWNKLLDDVVACGGYAPDEAGTLRRLLEVYRPHFDRPVPASLLHMDVWSQNILVDDGGNVTGLVDLDRALWGDPEIEFAVLDYCGISEPPFWQGYGRARDISFSAQIRARFYLLYEVQKYIVIRICRRDDPAQALEYKQQSFALAGPLRQALG
jgi:fructosamine-3-kinase